MKANVLLFGAGSFIAKAFIEKYEHQYHITKVYRSRAGGELHFDFEGDDTDKIVKQLNNNFHAVLFFQGINPSVGANDTTEAHFNKMLKINLTTPALLLKSLSKKLEPGALVLFTSSVAKKKGSYDPAYASAKAGLKGLMYSLAGAWPQIRFNMISLGLVENSPVYHQMTTDFRQKHADKMFNNNLVKVDDVISMVAELIVNKSITRKDIEIDGGYN